MAKANVSKMTQVMRNSKISTPFSMFVNVGLNVAWKMAVYQKSNSVTVNEDVSKKMIRLYEEMLWTTEINKTQ